MRVGPARAAAPAPAARAATLAPGATNCTDEVGARSSVVGGLVRPRARDQVGADNGV